jgi:predicted PurR-regulated permease PerM
VNQINWPRLRDILISIICIGILFWAGWSILSQFVHAIILLLLAMAVAFLVTPVVNVLNRYMPRTLAALLVFIVILGALGGLCYALVFSLIQQVEYFAYHLPGYVNDLPQTYKNFQTWLVQQGIPQSNITDTLNQLQNQISSFLNELVSNVLNIVFFVTDIFVNILLLVVLSFYLTIDGKRIRNSIVGIMPRRSLSHVLLFEDALNRVVGNYIRGQLTLALIIGLLAGLGCSVFGLGSYALIVGVMAFLFETIPMVGPALASIPALLISLLLPDPFPRTIYLLIYFICVQMVESNILGPRIVGHAVGLHPVASILALIIGAQLFGAVGALLATPILAAMWVVVASLYNSIRGQSVDAILSAKKRSSWIRRRESESQDPPRPKRLHFLTNLNLRSNDEKPPEADETTGETADEITDIDLLTPVASATSEDDSSSSQV